LSAAGIVTKRGTGSVLSAQAVIMQAVMPPVKAFQGEYDTLLVIAFAFK
jgi:hypothetical protein